MLYVYQRLISIHPFYMTMIIYMFKFIIYIGKISLYDLLKWGCDSSYYKISLPLKLKNIH